MPTADGGDIYLYLDLRHTNAYPSIYPSIHIHLYKIYSRLVSVIVQDSLLYMEETVVIAPEELQKLYSSILNQLSDN